MKSFKFLIALMLLAITASASAQSPNADSGKVLVKENRGYNRIHIGYAPQVFTKTTSDTKESLTNHGFIIGYLHGFNITGKKLPLFVEVGADVTFCAKNESLFDVKYGAADIYQAKLLSFCLPVNLAYKFSFRNGMWIEPYAGMIFKANAMASFENKYSNALSYNNGINRFQYCGQTGANLGYKRMNLNIGYHWDTPLHRGWFSASKIFTRGLIVSLGYNF